MLNQRRHQWTPAFAAVVTIGLLTGGCGGPRGPQQGPPQVSVVTIKTESLVLTTALPGRTAPYRVAEVRPQVNGIILKRAFTEGSDVQAGDLLYQIDPAPYQAVFNQAKAAVAMAEANLPATRLREARFKELVTSHAIGQQDYDDVLAALKQMEAQLEVSKAAMESANINLSYTPIKAPISGRIGRSSVTEGALVTAYQPVSLATIQQLDPIYVDVPQSTTELFRLRRRMAEGQLNQNGAQQNKVKLIQQDGTPYPPEGTLEFRDVTVDSTTGSVILRIVVPNPDSALLPGMFVRAILQEGINEEAILVPQQGVSRNPKGDPYALLVDAEEKVEYRPLTLDRAIGDKWLVSAGLKAGDRVIVEGSLQVRPGAAVKAVPFSAAQAGGPATGQAGVPAEKTN